MANPGGWYASHREGTLTKLLQSESPKLKNGRTDAKHRPTVAMQMHKRLKQVEKIYPKVGGCATDCATTTGPNE